MSRYRMKKFHLTPTLGGRHHLEIALGEVYCELVDRAFPDLVKSAWVSTGSHYFATTISNLHPDVEISLRAYLTLLTEVWVLRLNQHLAPQFKSDDLDGCYAIDFNLKSDLKTRTPTGSLEAAAKDGNREAAIALAHTLADICRRHPNLSEAGHFIPVPASPGSDYHLPELLVGALGSALGRNFIPGIRKVKKTGKIRDVPLKDKVDTLAGAFEVIMDVRGQSIVLVDDLYQSGTTLWTLARLLKKHGAARVYGLVCVKSMRDTDNQ